MILDGWGISTLQDGNAVFQAKTPNLDKYLEEYPNTSLLCAGEAVGLPGGIMGNSEVGHLNIGAGRVVYQDLLRINLAVRDKSFFENRAMNSVMDKAVAGNKSLHLMGLLSDGGVHSDIGHLFALIDMAHKKGVSQVYVHAILDGRDTPPKSGAGYVKQLVDHIESNGYGAVASVCGRFYAMDRDKRWDRVEKAYNLYTKGEGELAAGPVEAVQNAYEQGQTDEFVLPTVITGKKGGIVSDGDGFIFFNFRADRAREITSAFIDPDFKEFDRKSLPNLCEYVCMTMYDGKFGLPTAFPPERHERILGQLIGEQGLHQLRIAETEKYAHVTYFFNGGEEEPFSLEDRVLVPSPREVATYDEKPEMSAHMVTEEVLSRIIMEKYDLIVINYANMDMVGHTGIMSAAKSACETVDGCVKKVVDKVLEKGGAALITADHGNAEKMKDENGKPHTAHTLNPVPLVYVNNGHKDAVLKPGALGDIAPTILDILGIGKPEQMTGNSLIERP